MAGADATTLPPHMTRDDVEALLSARHDRPFDVLGIHKTGRAAWCVALVPDARAVVARLMGRAIKEEHL